MWDVVNQNATSLDQDELHSATLFNHCGAVCRTGGRSSRNNLKPFELLLLCVIIWGIRFLCWMLAACKH